MTSDVAGANAKDAAGVLQCFHTVTARLHVLVAPAYVQAPLDGIRAQHLDAMVMTYFAPARGVVVLYRRLRLGLVNRGEDGVVARIPLELPFAFLWVLVELLVWRPLVGDVLEGHVHMQLPLHIGLLVHDTFNASIKKWGIPHEWLFVPLQADETQDPDAPVQSLGHWVDAEGVPVQGKLQFTVRAVHTSGRVVSVEGTLVQPRDEPEAQPVEVVPEPVRNHVRFDDAPAVPAAPVSEFVPGYTNSSGELDDSD